jgi:two-component system chemotaxis sensor kinase CheA
MDEEILRSFSPKVENLGRLDSEIVLLEKNPKDAALLASIFRTVHTIKGTCGFIGLTRLGSVAHSAESVLGQMRDGTIEVTQRAISLVLRAVDVIKELLQGLEATREEPSGDFSSLIAELDDFVAGPAVAAPIVESSVSATPTAVGAAETIPQPAVPQVPPTVMAENSVPAPSSPQVAVAPVISEVPEIVESREEVGAADGKKSVADLSIRVNVDVLDSLMNLVGELVLTRNQLLQLSRGDDESKYAAPITHLNRVTTDLQEGVMKTRMQPIGNAWSKLPRLVRDLSQVTGKQIDLEMIGAETELDRTVLDAIKDPLTHMVRNSADHGIETAARPIDR